MPSVNIRKILFWATTALLGLAVLAILFSVQAYRLRREIADIPELTDTLRELGSMALAARDVPVGAVLLYRGEILGRGYNRVMKDTNLAAHAEIVAMNDALKKLGMMHFNSLDREELVMVSSYEPCEMCRGAMVHYGIRNIRFLKDKPFSMWLKTSRRQWLYEWGKRKAEGEEMQDSLFHLHPDYPGK